MRIMTVTPITEQLTRKTVFSLTVSLNVRDYLVFIYPELQAVSWSDREAYNICKVLQLRAAKIHLISRETPVATGQVSGW